MPVGGKGSRSRTQTLTWRASNGRRPKQQAGNSRDPFQDIVAGGAHLRAAIRVIAVAALVVTTLENSTSSPLSSLSGPGKRDSGSHAATYSNSAATPSMVFGSTASNA